MHINFPPRFSPNNNRFKISLPEALNRVKTNCELGIRSENSENYFFLRLLPNMPIKTSLGKPKNPCRLSLSSFSSTFVGLAHSASTKNDPAIPSQQADQTLSPPAVLIFLLIEIPRESMSEIYP